MEYQVVLHGIALKCGSQPTMPATNNFVSNNKVAKQKIKYIMKREKKKKIGSSLPDSYKSFVVAAM